MEFFDEANKVSHYQQHLKFSVDIKDYIEGVLCPHGS